MISPAIAASIFKSLGFDPDAFKKIIEGFVSKIDEWDALFKRNTQRQEEHIAMTQELAIKFDLFRSRVDPDSVGETPIGDFLATHPENIVSGINGRDTDGKEGN